MSSPSGTGREPRLALSATFEWSRRGLPSLADVAAPLAVISGAFSANGAPGPLHVHHAHSDGIGALTVAEEHGAPLIISAGQDGALRSWRLDSTPGPLHVNDAHTARIMALAVAEEHGVLLIISASHDGALRSWRLDGTPGPLHVDDAHNGGIGALAVVEDDGASLIISAGADGALRSWRLGACRSLIAELEGDAAATLAVRQLSFASPLEIALTLPAELAAAPVALAAALVMLKRIAAPAGAGGDEPRGVKRLVGLPLEILIYLDELRAERLRAQMRLLEVRGQVDAVRAERLRQQSAAWRLTQVTLSEVNDE